MHHGVDVRAAVAEDVASVTALVEQYWACEAIQGFEPGRITQQLRSLMAQPQLGSLWIARDGGSLAGYLLAVYVFSLEYGGLTAEIDELFVLPAHRARGLGGSLLHAAEHEFARLGCRKVALQLSRRNAAARAFYHRHGYAERAGYELLDKTPASTQ